MHFFRDLLIIIRSMVAPQYTIQSLLKCIGKYIFVKAFLFVTLYEMFKKKYINLMKKCGHTVTFSKTHLLFCFFWHNNFTNK